jgi:hypothetical protein
MNTLGCPRRLSQVQEEQYDEINKKDGDTELLIRS